MTTRFFVLALALVGCGGAAPTVGGEPTRVAVQNQIFGTRAEGTARELRERGERALLAQRWQEAASAFETLLAGDAAANEDPEVHYDLGLAYEGLGERTKARERYRELTRRFPAHALARGALVREASLDAYLEDWSALGEVGRSILARSDIDPAERMLGLGARALARLDAGDEAAAAHDVSQGLDLMEEHRYGATGQLPVAAAMLQYALGESRRLRSEKISLDPPGPDFVQKLELRCQGLLDAQSAYANAIRSIDLHWAAMSGYRVGEMYRTLHRHLMMLPAPAKAKTEHDRQLFYGIMHVRYRVLLEKGLEMMKRTIGLGERVETEADKARSAAPDAEARGPGAPFASAWMKRADAAKVEMERALEEEQATIEKFPFTEEELQKALEIMKRKAAEDAEKAAKASASKG